MTRNALPVGLAIGLLASSLFGPHAAARSTPAAVLDALFPEGRRTEALDRLVASHELPADVDFHLVELGHDAGTSHHLVWIRDREQPHRHDRHDLFVVMLRGHGRMQIQDEERAVGAGSILYIPRGTLHAFRNASPEPAVAYAVYAPAFDGKDRILEE